jgi:hypothetical protein
MHPIFIGAALGASAAVLANRARIQRAAAARAAAQRAAVLANRHRIAAQQADRAAYQSQFDPVVPSDVIPVGYVKFASAVVFNFDGTIRAISDQDRAVIRDRWTINADVPIGFDYSPSTGIVGTMIGNRKGPNLGRAITGIIVDNSNAHGGPYYASGRDAAGNTYVFRFWAPFWFHVGRRA